MRSLFIALLCAALPLCGFSAEVEGIAKNNTLKIGDNPPIRVLLMDSTTTLSLTPKGAWTIAAKSGGKKLADLAPDTTAILKLEKGKILLPDGKDLGKGPLTISAADPAAVMAVSKIPYGVGWWWASYQDRKYTGKFDLFVSAKGKLEVVLELPLEEYMRGVVPSEIGATAPAAALASQAVAGRSAAVLALTTKIYSGKNHNICADVACQAFSGLTINSPASDKAVEDTRGVILAFEGRAVSAYYASNCGGVTEDIRNVWDARANDKAYWNSERFDGEATTDKGIDLTTDEGVKQWLADPPMCFCNPAISRVSGTSMLNWRWERQITAEELTKAAKDKKKKDIGAVTAIKAVKRGKSGRMIEAEFVGTKGSVKVGKELAIREMCTPPLRSACFIAEPCESLTEAGKEGKPGFIIRGAGWGHGVGMCQTGAIGMAHEGKPFTEILKHYFPNTNLEKLY